MLFKITKKLPILCEIGDFMITNFLRTMSEHLFNLKFAVKELERNSKKCEKEEKMEKEKAKKAIQKGNMEGARIHAENAIRQKNQALNYLRMSARVDAVSSRVQTALTTRKVILFFIYYGRDHCSPSTSEI